MLLLRSIIALAVRDYSHEWRMSICYILSLAAVLTPLLVLFGLKFGIITTMLAELADNPKNREIHLLSSGSFNLDWFAKLRKRNEVGFLSPNTRALAANIDLKKVDAPDIISVELIPTGQADPLLKGKKTPEDINEIVLSASAAAKLKIRIGETIDGSLQRQFEGKLERVHLPFRVVDIANANRFSRYGAFATLELLTAAESYRDGRAVESLRWSGSKATDKSQDTRFASFRLYAKTIDDVLTLSQLLTTEGLEIKTNSDEIFLVKAIDNNLTIVFWIIAIAAMFGFVLSLSASLWANVDRKRKELCMLRLVGFNTRDIIIYPTFQSLVTGGLGWLAAVLGYLLMEKLINHILAPNLDSGDTICFLLLQHFGIALLLTIFSALTAGILGGLRAAKIEPSDGLRDI